MSKQSEIQKIKTELLEIQNWKCPLCNLDLRDVISRNICLDHDHDSGVIRAVLCRNCNAMEGKIIGCANRAKRGDNKYAWLLRSYKYVTGTHTAIIHPNHKTPEQKKEARKKRAKRKKRNNPRPT